MLEKNDQVRSIAGEFFRKALEVYPVKKVLLYGSYAKGTATEDSDLDLGVVLDMADHKLRIDISTGLFSIARKIDIRIEPKCIFWDEFINCPPDSILSEIIRTGVDVPSA
ncbi:MAG: nucleotidyltransferase domain-containing protein [Candidatus Wallbacteria bacterium]|nr:nucleotidyltransferase domain-containing protein [Candidatus Wallbacteria bacterium]